MTEQAITPDMLRPYFTPPYVDDLGEKSRTHALKEYEEGLQELANFLNLVRTIDRPMSKGEIEFAYRGRSYSQWFLIFFLGSMEKMSMLQHEAGLDRQSMWKVTPQSEWLTEKQAREISSRKREEEIQRRKER